MKYAMLLDLSMCVGCEACTVACKLDDKTGASEHRGRVAEEEVGVFPDVKKMYVPLLCMQCESPECVDICPTGASYQGEDGIVRIDPSKCMGCKACMVACPYNARFLAPAGFVEKCDFCALRLSGGGLPLCAETCPYGARVFGDLEDPDSEVSRKLSESKVVVLKAGRGYGPKVRYLVSG